MSKTITQTIEVFGYDDLKTNDELCEKIYQKFWLDDPDNINTSADENLNSFKKFAETLDMKFNWSLSYTEYPDRGCYIKLIPNYHLDNKHYKEILQDYKGNGYCFCDDLETFTNKLLDKKEYKVLCEWSTNDFVLEIQNRMLEMWFQDNRDYLSKECFLDHVESNSYEFTIDGKLFGGE